MEVVVGLAERIAVMHHGALLAFDTPEVVMRTRRSRPPTWESRCERGGRRSRSRTSTCTSASRTCSRASRSRWPKGRVTALLGRNGVGKTTTLRACSGSCRGRAARSRVEGEDVTRLADACDRPTRRRLRARGPRRLRRADRRGEPPPRASAGSRAVRARLRPLPRAPGARRDSARERSRADSSRWSRSRARSSTRTRSCSSTSRRRASRRFSSPRSRRRSSARPSSRRSCSSSRTSRVVQRVAEDVVVLDGGRVVHAGAATESCFASPERVRELLGVHGAIGSRT